MRDDMYLHSYHFQDLGITKSPIQHIHPDAFRGLVNLKYLECSFCELKNIPPLKDINTTLQYLSLTNNFINDVPEDA